MSTAARASLATLGCLSLLHATAEEAPPRRFELTPHAGYRIGGEFEAQDGSRTFEIREGDAQGLLLNVRATADTQWEVLLGRQRTFLDTTAPFAGEPTLDIDVEYLQFGGTYLFPGEHARAFVALTAGLARFDPGAGLSAENYLSGSLGGGVMLRADEPLGVRLEARVFGTLVDSDGGVFCATGGPTNFCTIAIDGTALFQWEARAGVVFRF